MSESQHLCEKIYEQTALNMDYVRFRSEDRKESLEHSVCPPEDKNSRIDVLIHDKQEDEVAAIAGSSKRIIAATTALNDEAVSSNSIKTSISTEMIPSTTLKLITWNVDGLDEENLKIRTKAVCKYIIDEQADIVFLQEVVPETAQFFTKHMTDYDCLFADKVGYFIGTLFKKSTVTHDNGEVIEFPDSRMMRNVLKFKATFRNIPLCLYTSHLESLGKYSAERRKQLKSVFRKVIAAPKDETVIFGGDLNLRDWELLELGGLPDNIEDVWRTCGSPLECMYTFDTTKNDNLQATFTAQNRFDRVYMRASSPPKLKPTSFSLIGLERLPRKCFPSDHWGILTHFETEE